ncbi:MAG: hypothetical protein QY331_04105 [Melioribacteraceae bacterium]|nr:MAG: hypothetical protein QY331_04105 [Melioribacteraceae bacterium]
MKITTLVQYFSAFSILFPLSAAVVYWIKRKFTFEKRVNIIAAYFIIALVTQVFMLLLSFSGQSNLSVIRIYVIIESLILSYFLLSIQIKSSVRKLSLTFLFGLIIFLVDYYWGKPNSLPIESIMFESIIITIIGMTTIPEIRLEKSHENSFYYFVFAIMVYSVNNLIGYGFMELAPGFSLTVQAIVNVVKNLIFTWGFYLLIKK